VDLASGTHHIPQQKSRKRRFRSLPLPPPAHGTFPTPQPRRKSPCLPVGRVGEQKAHRREAIRRTGDGGVPAAGPTAWQTHLRARPPRDVRGAAAGRGAGAEAAVRPAGRAPCPSAAGGVAPHEHAPQRRRPAPVLRRRRGARGAVACRVERRLLCAERGLHRAHARRHQRQRDRHRWRRPNAQGPSLLFLAPLVIGSEIVPKLGTTICGIKWNCLRGLLQFAG
jgi:hypothetical protein